MLLLLFGVAFGIGVAIVLMALHWNRRASSLPVATTSSEGDAVATFRGYQLLARRPTSWLAIRSHNPDQVLDALALSDPTPCSWNDGMVGENSLFIAPPVRGWVLVVGTAVPDPADDVDACFRFLRELSRKLGEVQFFCANRVLHHHAWARVETGRVIRAYAWAGETLWNQGVKTALEINLGLETFGYGEEVPSTHWGTSDFFASNVEKIPRLAARWSLDPAEIAVRLPPDAQGIAGRPSVRY